MRSECTRYQIQAISRAARKDDFISTLGTQKIRDFLAHTFIGFSRIISQLIKTTMHIGIFINIVVLQAIQQGLRFL